MRTRLIQVITIVLVVGSAFLGIQWFNRYGLPVSQEAMLGLPPKDMVSGKKFELNWCSSNAVKVVAPDRFVADQKDFEWSIAGEPPQPLDYLLVERWFTENCRVEVTLARHLGRDEATQPSPGFVDELIIEFADGKEVAIQKNASGQLRIGAMLFEAPNLLKALENVGAEHWIKKTKSKSGD